MFIRADNVSTLPNFPQNTGAPSSWDPSTISNIVFGTIMVFVGIVAIWQGRHRRVVALDEELAIIRPFRTPMSSLNRLYVAPDDAIQEPVPQLMLHNTSTASSSTAQPTIMNGGGSERGLSVADNNIIIPTISNRVTTLSTIGNISESSARCSHDMVTSELDVTGLEGSINTTEILDDQGTSLGEMA